MSSERQPTIGDLIPAATRLLLTGGGREFINRIGVDATRAVIHHVMMGENLRQQTEPLTRRRVAQVSGGLVALLAKGTIEDKNFATRLSTLAREQLTAKGNDKAAKWMAQWLIGLTNKSVQNVLRGKAAALSGYLQGFDLAVQESAENCARDLGALKMTLSFQEASSRSAELNWPEITRLTTAIGAQTLAIRGSDKSIYGKLFERLILGSFLTILGFKRVDPGRKTRDAGVFWLSDSSENRESDATLLFRPGKIAKFDIGFIGPGNPEISKDKLSRQAREAERDGAKVAQVTFIVVDRLPETSKTMDAAKAIGAEIIQMSMQFWPRLLARRLQERLGLQHELASISDSEIGAYLQHKLSVIAVQDFLEGLSTEDLLKEIVEEENEVSEDE